MTEYETLKTRRNTEKENCETNEKNIEAGHLVEDKKLLEDEQRRFPNTPAFAGDCGAGC